MKTKSTYKKPVYIVSLVLWILLALSSVALYLMVFVKQIANLKQIENFVNTKKVYLINSATCLGIAAIVMLVFNIFDKLRLDAHDQIYDVIKRKKMGIIITGVIFTIIFSIYTVILFLIIFQDKNAQIQKLLTKAKITVKPEEKIYWVYAAYGSAIALGLILLRTIICSIIILPSKKLSLGTSSNTIAQESTKDEKETKEEDKSSTVEIVKSTNPNMNQNEILEIDFSKFNLKVIEDTDNKLATSNTPITNEKIQELQNLFNEVTAFEEKIDHKKYSSIVKYVQDSLETFTVKVNENLTQESVITKINNLTINFKRARLLLLLLDCREYAIEISSAPQLKLIGNNLLNFVTKKINEFNDLNSLRKTKTLINEILTEYLIAKLSQYISEVEIEIRRNPNQEALIKEALDIIKASKAAMNKKNINAIKQAITHLEKIKEAFSKIGYGNLYQ